MCNVFIMYIYSASCLFAVCKRDVVYTMVGIIGTHDGAQALCEQYNQSLAKILGQEEEALFKAAALSPRSVAMDHFFQIRFSFFSTNGNNSSKRLT